MAKVGQRNRVFASVAVHPPKFFAASRFLSEWARCQGAVDSLDVLLVFSSVSDRDQFRKLQECLSPDVSPELYQTVLTVNDVTVASRNGGDQAVAALKKWTGIAEVLEKDDGPGRSEGAAKREYGMMLDSELLVYDFHGGPNASISACASGGAWSRLLDRLRAAESSKTFNAARVSSTLSTYDFGGFKMSGKDYDRHLLQENADFVTKGFSICNEVDCEKVQTQVRDVLFSWWTDVPWMNLQVARRMLLHLAGAKPSEPPRSWRQLASKIPFRRFEIIGYHQYCVLFEGFQFKDVADVTGEAPWGSFMEDPRGDARLDEVDPPPLWVSTEAARHISKRGLRMSPEAPPLLLFHADHEGCAADPTLCSVDMALWQAALADSRPPPPLPPSGRRSGRSSGGSQPP